MLPRLIDGLTEVPGYAEFLSELHARGFEGDVSSGLADRIVLATDNSIYQMTPQATVFPRSVADVVRIAKIALNPVFSHVTLSPRGGGTGTNGQSLTDGVVVDLSRHMNKIIEINAEERWARVEAGVVKDQLNAALAVHGLFFPPELSTSNRATIGGMISTDASGQGSCLYGKTRNHVLELTTVLMDGTVWGSMPVDDDELMVLKKRKDIIGEIHTLVDSIHRDNADLIERQFPKLNRCLTGYDLAHIRNDQGLFDLNSVLCGSEGTLGLLVEAKLNVLPIPKYSALVNVRYGSFDAALRDGRELLRFGAASIETVDSKILSLAQDDIIWDDVKVYFPADAGERAVGVNLVEFVGDTKETVEEPVRRLTDMLGACATNGRRGFTIARGEHEVSRIWEMRKKSVGLLGNMQGEKRPIPFVEDTAVPPENLADYIKEFRAALDRRGLTYGMFGHVDAGVLHVRPAIDMKDPSQESLIRAITEEVVGITRKYGGLLWGEHGKGVRSEFSPEFFGDLYPALQAIKQSFDPRNQLNPGKIAAPGGENLLTIDGLTTRGQLDRTIPPAARAEYEEALHCNGNGACFNWDPDDAMCPSYKATRLRHHSPKGRASLIREWLRLMAATGFDPAAGAHALRASSPWKSLPRRMLNTWSAHRGEADFSHDVKEAMDGCLACKSCVGQCPIKVDVPSFRAKFLELYHSRYLRPARDHLVGWLEPLMPLFARAPGLYNALLGSGIGRRAIRTLGLAETPKLSPLRLGREMRKRGIGEASPKALRAISEADRARSVILVQDAFTSYYETQLVIDVLDLLLNLGFKPWVAPFKPNGKPLHVHGFLKSFQRTASRNAAMLGALAEIGVPLVGLDPSMTLTYRFEYAGALKAEQPPPVLLLQEWLAQHLDATKPRASGREHFLLPHCTERTTAPESLRSWQEVFERFGLTLHILSSGCCGMAGTYGHEAEHRATSEHIYGMSWAKHVAAKARNGALLATGYSCRSQVKLVDRRSLLHPAQALLRAATSSAQNK
jgi:FAD/FMN-containing dehydrogenase/Fe-S oxidoreductase